MDEQTARRIFDSDSVPGIAKMMYLFDYSLDDLRDATVNMARVADRLEECDAHWYTTARYRVFAACLAVASNDPALTPVVHKGRETADEYRKPIWHLMIDEVRERPNVMYAFLLR
ncbi:hypothetical protein [Nocardia sp. alder85J]|uniref:hypothetical protein n=1 Tax=Nocardia sp. alder85J TaxID=2862949 RepID=UPI002256922C|nr:hypothetical protein [Nocardia sp. alder85J]MCX4097396.1 hypothetical protein [Nocardia sp. alder85J]